MRILILIGLFFVYMGTSLGNVLNETAPLFNIKVANQQFDHINLQLSTQNLSLANLETAVDTLTKLITKAEQCEEETGKKMQNTELLIKEGTSPLGNQTEGADLVYLNNQQKTLADEQAQCRLFIIRAKEAIDAYKTTITKLKQAETMTRGLPLWSIAHEMLRALPEIELKRLLTVEIPEATPSLLAGLIFSLIAWGLSMFLYMHIQKTRFAHRYFLTQKPRVSHLALLTTFFISIGFYTYVLFYSHNLPATTLLLQLSTEVLFYISSLMCLTLLFNIRRLRALLHWYGLSNTFFQSFIIAVLSFYTTAQIGQLFAASFNPQSPLWQFLESSYVLMALISSAYFTYYFCHRHRHIAWIKNHVRLIFNLSILLLIPCAIADVLGYYTMAQHLTFSGLTTCAITVITLLVAQGIHNLYLLLGRPQARTSQFIKYFGYKTEQTQTEFLILKTVLQFLVIITGIYFIGETWEFATNFIENVYEELLDGVHVVNFTIYPARIITGVVVFCLLHLLFRAISTRISSHQQFEEEEETQVAVASILTYIGFTIAFISGLLVAGFDFTGLAIIAGALSVGIGLGLQSIVNNFVSGLILLIEKPIKPGDRINVDGIEGFVKKIRVRSTQILTPSREDIIVPNSDLITRRVTNYMYSDKFCNIHCEVGVAYGSDTSLVHDVLLSVANNHDEVVKTGRNKPTVLFRSFADHSLIFHLNCLIKDVNKKSAVKSDLNFAIEQAFREHHIDMPFPQRELHFKLSDIAAVSKKLKELTE